MPAQNGSPAAVVRYWRDIASASWLAIDSIRAHKLRTFLTLLGVIVGVASVIMVGATFHSCGLLPACRPTGIRSQFSLSFVIRSNRAEQVTFQLAQPAAQT